MSEFTPTLRVTEVGGQVRVGLDEFGFGEGRTMQDAADALVCKMLAAAIALRSGSIGPFSSDLLPDPAAVRFLWELSELASRGGDIRERLFGVRRAAA
jgi:hypothetical protein